MNIPHLVLWIPFFAGLVITPVGDGWRLSASSVPRSGAQTKASQKTVQMHIAGVTCALSAGLEVSIGARTVS